MTTGLRILAIDSKIKDSDLFGSNQYGGMIEIVENDGVEIGTGVEELDRQRHEQIMSIQTPVSIDRAFNEIMNNSRSPHISNEPYPLYDE